MKGTYSRVDWFSYENGRRKFRIAEELLWNLLKTFRRGIETHAVAAILSLANFFKAVKATFSETTLQKSMRKRNSFNKHVWLNKPEWLYGK